MATDLIEIDAEQPDPEAIARAAALVRRGRVVAIPTDALYTVVAPAPEQSPPSSTISTRPSIAPNTSIPDRHVGCPEILALVEISG